MFENLGLGFLLTDCKNMTLTNVSSVNCDVGVGIADSSNIKIDGFKALNTKTAVKGERVRGLEAKNMFHSESDGLQNMSLLAVAIMRINHGYV
jgi:predicted ATP-grasp superfamily ATP-dependent carboligase